MDICKVVKPTAGDGEHGLMRGAILYKVRSGGAWEAMVKTGGFTLGWGWGMPLEGSEQTNVK